MEIGVGPQVLKVWKILKAPFFLLSCLSGLPSRIEVSRCSLVERSCDEVTGNCFNPSIILGI
jgi:hypothetical protein